MIEVLSLVALIFAVSILNNISETLDELNDKMPDAE
jgi:hypothetical protein